VIWVSTELREIWQMDRFLNQKAKMVYGAGVKDIKRKQNNK
jgi:hypothetical protein